MPSTKPVKAQVWDKARWYYDGDSLSLEDASRHIYFVLRWLAEKGLLKKSGQQWLGERELNLEVSLVRNDVTKQGTQFLDAYYETWLDEVGVNMQMDPKCGDEEGRLDRYWEKFQAERR